MDCQIKTMMRVSTKNIDKNNQEEEEEGGGEKYPPLIYKK